MPDEFLNYFIAKAFKHAVPAVRHITRSRLRHCRLCQHFTLFLAVDKEEEFHVCVRCRANLRYELLATYIRSASVALEASDVLELDPDSPLRRILVRARTYTRSFFRPNVPPGTRRADGVVCEDITALTFENESLDLIVSSDVLEHVPEPGIAFRETARVLREGGVHIFTVPPKAATRQRARYKDGSIDNLVTPPEYHRDPLDPAGVLVFWEYGPDLPEFFATRGLEFSIVQGPEGRSQRIVWAARKRSKSTT